jgi:pro-apoptotic serine protease NMA111
LGLVAVVTVDRDLLHAGLTAPKFSSKVLRIGDEIEDFSLDAALQLNLKTTRIKDMGSLLSPITVPPRYRTTNIEAIFLMDFVPTQGGLYLDPEDKSVVALSMPLNYQGIRGVDYNFYIRPIIKALQGGEPLKRRCMGWRVSESNLSECLELGLRQERAIRMVQLAKAQNALPRPLAVSGPLRPIRQGLENLQIGDILIEINGAPVIRVTDLHILTQVESAKLLVSRNGEEVLVNLQTYELPSEWIDKILFWAGAVLHRTHDPVLEQISPEFAAVSEVEGFRDPASAPYMSSYFFGSPAYGIPNTQWILEVDGHRVRSLQDMLAVVENLKNKDGEYIRVKTLHRVGTTTISTIRLDSKFWPASTLENKDGKWLRTDLE